MKSLIRVFLFSFLIFLSGCSYHYVADYDTIQDGDDQYLEASDRKLLSQDIFDYIDHYDADVPYLTDREELKENLKYNRAFFSPWTRKKPLYGKKAVKWGFNVYKSNVGYGENKRKRSKKFMKELLKEANLRYYPNRKRKGITIFDTNLRVVPTYKPHFKSFTEAAQGYPFDNFQHSLVPANTPLYISHITKDKEWVLVETPFALGWLPIRDIAYVNKDFISVWKTNNNVGILNDDVPIYDSNDTLFLFKVNIGMQFPIAREHEDGFDMLVARADEGRNAYIEEVFISDEDAVRKPLVLTNNNVACLIDKMIGKPYGWGGLYNNRDCSSMTRDLFSVFSIWLSRNSQAQVKYNGGRFISLKNFSKKVKKRIIINKGVPFTTLLWIEGHVMLYIGSEGDEPLVFHNIWGLKTKVGTKKEEVKIIGRGIITTLEPGKRLFGIKEDLIEKIEGMTILL